MYKKNIFIKGQIFHICNKSIVNYGIFRDPKNAERFIKGLNYYNSSKKKLNLALHLRSEVNKQKKVNLLVSKAKRVVKIISYCIMPDHYHLLLKVLVNKALSKYIGDVENSFTRFFNIKFRRKGPLWQSRFRRVEINTNEQLLHVSRYIHLNPTTAELVDKPEDWKYSSYNGYINNSKILNENMKEITINNPVLYKKFCEDNIDYQKKWKKIKRLSLE